MSYPTLPIRMVSTLYKDAVMAQHRAAVLLPTTSLGGAERMGLRIANDLAERGVDTHIVLLDDTAELTHTISKAVNMVKRNRPTCFHGGFERWRASRFNSINFSIR